MNKKFSRLAMGFATVAMIVTPLVTLAADAPANLDLGLNYATGIGLGSRDVRDTISGIVRAFLGILGILAVLIVLYGGFKWMTSGGNDKGAQEGTKIMTQGVIGLIIIISAFALSQFVINAVVNQSS